MNYHINLRLILICSFMIQNTISCQKPENDESSVSGVSGRVGKDSAATSAISLPGFHSYDILFNKASSEGTVTNGDIAAKVKFYIPENDCSVLSGKPLKIYEEKSHPESFNNLHKYWYSDHGYPYVGFSSVPRGSDKSEKGHQKPLGMYDLQMHPPAKGCDMVASSFEVPKTGEYQIRNFGVRKVSAQGKKAQVRIHNQSGTIIHSIDLQSTEWIFTKDPVNMGSLTKGEKFYFSVHSKDDYEWDAVEISWSIESQTDNAECRRPFNKAISIPGTIEAENYDIGCSGQMAYYDTSPENVEGFYREDAVDIGPGEGNGHAITWISDGEWWEYTVDVEKETNYSTRMLVSSAKDPGTLRFLVNGVDVGSAKIAPTGGWDIWKTIQGPTLALKSGKQIIRIVSEVNGYNIDSIQFKEAIEGEAPPNEGDENEAPPNEGEGNEQENPTPKGWNLIWSDEFNQGNAPDLEFWEAKIDGKGGGNNELQYYYDDPKNIRVNDGKLILEAHKEKIGGRDYSSGKLVTKVNWKYGRIDVRAKLPSGRGTWPAIWMMPEDAAYGGWPHSGEIDIMEHVGYEQDKVHSNIHTTSYNHMNGTNKGGSLTVTNASDEFHTYSVEWSEDQLSFYVNNNPKPHFVFKNDKTNNKKRWPFDQNFYLILNIAVGGSWGGSKGIDDSIFPQKMEIDYVRVYKKSDDPVEQEPDQSIPGDSSTLETTLLQWNVYYQNKDTQGMAQVIKEKQPDVVGLCEFTGSMTDMASAISSATGRSFKAQPGRSSWQGYGTDIFYDSTKWQALEGGVKKVYCNGTRGGDRAANWVVLKDKASGKKIITGGIHLSYCGGGCDATHACELGMLYDQFDSMKSKYPDAGIVWMGDLNRSKYDTIMKNIFDGNIQGRATFSTEDVVKNAERTYYTGGVIDWILAEEGIFEMISGGSTNAGRPGSKIGQADHFPIYSKLEMR